MAFGIDLNTINEPDSPFPTAVRESLIAPIWALMHPFHAIDFTSYGYQNTVVEAIHFLRDTGKKIIDKRRRAMKNGDNVPLDILTYLLETVEEDISIDYEELLDHFVTFFIAGTKLQWDRHKLGYDILTSTFFIIILVLSCIQRQVSSFVSFFAIGH